ncbi:pentapeptide repeat-containing protein [Rhodococcus tukisamuensis]
MTIHTGGRAALRPALPPHLDRARFPTGGSGPKVPTADAQPATITETGPQELEVRAAIITVIRSRTRKTASLERRWPDGALVLYTADLRDVCLVGADLRGADLSGANLVEVSGGRLRAAPAVVRLDRQPGWPMGCRCGPRAHW